VAKVTKRQPRMTTKKTKKEKADPRVEAMIREMNTSSHEIAGQLMDQFQTIETLMKLYITRKDTTKSLDDFEGRTFGQVFAVFKKHSTDETLNQWLETLRQLRNDVAHTFFRDTKALAREVPLIEHFNHKVLRKGLRITEICFIGLKKMIGSNGNSQGL
jgi:hypothetical protein